VDRLRRILFGGLEGENWPGDAQNSSPASPADLRFGSRLLCRIRRRSCRIVTIFRPGAAETMLVDEVKLKIRPVTKKPVTLRVWTPKKPTLSFEVGIDVLPKRVVATP
jgi:hypothetical protein